MSFPAQVIRILIASPSDVSTERELAVRTIQEWNDLNSAERQIVLLPLRWETHSAPEYGVRPQEVINKQVVDHCDILVGIFWARIGSPTGIADSGTIEEIERVAIKGKPVMLYFSKAKHDPDIIDLDQLAKLREFKKKTFPKALVESFADIIEFKDKLSKQIEIQLRTLLAEQSRDGHREKKVRPITDILLHLADPFTGADLGVAADVETTFLNISNFEKVPDYSPAAENEKTEALGKWDQVLFTSLRKSELNKNYYRQRVTNLVVRGFFSPIRFWLKNAGGIGARDVYIDLRFQCDSDSFVIARKASLPSSAPSATTSGFLLAEVHPNSPEEVMKKQGNIWNSHMDISALQPQRELSPDVELMIGAKESCIVNIQAKIFADSLPEPTIQEVTIKLVVSELKTDADEVMSQIIIPNSNADARKPSVIGEGGLLSAEIPLVSKKRSSTSSKTSKPTLKK
ncbi:DUF4062 domain-containing protein [Comamonas thiooxydans]|uniref:DUF4062 domain-containing protein n=1 Tax=Comamonas thiooxydans TaxID=363952 RepID=UPI000A5CB579|nr:DUF4062 domain-containing protein [Comamonas thiooxydans]